MSCRLSTIAVFSNGMYRYLISFTYLTEGTRVFKIPVFKVRQGTFFSISLATRIALSPEALFSENAFDEVE